MTGEQVVGMMIAQINAHYQAEHQAVLYELYGAKNDPILLNQIFKRVLSEKVGDVKDIQDNGFEVQNPLGEPIGKGIIS